MMKECINDPNNLVNGYTEIWNRQFFDGENNIDYYYKMREKFNEKKIHTSADTVYFSSSS